MSDELYKTIGLGQQPNAMQGTPLQTPGITTPELIFRTIGSAMPPPGSLKVSNSIGGRIGGTAARIAGGFSTTLADELARQRLDPLQRRMAIAGQLQQMGTAASPQGPAQLGPEWAIEGGRPSGQEGPVMKGGEFLSKQPGMPPPPPLPMQVGPPKFDQKNIPVQERIAFADLIEPLQKMETAKVEQQLKEKMRDRAGYMTAGKSIIDLDAVGGPKAVYTEADTPGDSATNLKGKIAVKLSTDPVTGQIDYKKAEEVLRRMETTPQGFEGQMFNYYVEKNRSGVTDPAMERAIGEHISKLRDVAFNRGSGAEGGKVTIQNTPAAFTGAANVSQGRETGQLRVLASPEYQQAQAGIVAAKETAQRLNARMSPEIARRYTEYESIQRNLNTITQTYKPEYVGGIPAAIGFQAEFDKAIKDSLAQANDQKYQGGALIGRMQSYWGTLPPDQARFYRALTDNADRILRARSGAQINNQEATRLLEIVPKANDMPTVFEAKFGDFSNDIFHEQRTILDTVTQSPQALGGNLPAGPARLGAPRTPATRTPLPSAPPIAQPPPAAPGVVPPSGAVPKVLWMKKKEVIP